MAEEDDMTINDPRARQAMYMAKSGREKGSVRGGIYKAVLMIGIPIAVAVLVIWWMFF